MKIETLGVEEGEHGVNLIVELFDCEGTTFKGPPDWDDAPTCNVILPRGTYDRREGGAKPISLDKQRTSRFR